jgi:hypothetical protein
MGQVETRYRVGVCWMAAAQCAATAAAALVVSRLGEEGEDLTAALLSPSAATP